MNIGITELKSCRTILKGQQERIFFDEFISTIKKDNIKKIDITYEYITYKKNTKTIKSKIGKFILSQLKAYILNTFNSKNYNNLDRIVSNIVSAIKGKYLIKNSKFKIISDKFYELHRQANYLNGDTGNLVSDCMSKDVCHEDNYFQILTMRI